MSAKMLNVLLIFITLLINVLCNDLMKEENEEIDELSIVDMEYHLRQNKRRLVDPLTAGLTVATVNFVVSSVMQYGSGCYSPTCDYATIEFKNFFCGYPMEHLKHTTYDTIQDNPTNTISGGSQGTGGRYYGWTYANGVIRYKMDFSTIVTNGETLSNPDNYYIIDIYWCSDCKISCTQYSEGDCWGKYAFGMAIGWAARESLTVEKSHECFEIYAMNKFSDFNAAYIPSYCNLAWDTGFNNIYAAGGSEHHDLTFTWSYGPGIKLSGMMDESTYHTIDIEVTKVQGSVSKEKC